MLKGQNNFTGRVNIDRGAYIRSLNGFNLMALLDNLVFIHQLDGVSEIRAPVRFESDIKVQQLGVAESLETEHINGCSLEEWMQNTLRTDKLLNVTSKFYQNFDFPKNNFNNPGTIHILLDFRLRILDAV